MGNRLQYGLFRPWIAPIRDQNLSTDMQQFITWLQQSTNYLLNQATPLSLTAGAGISITGQWPNQKISSNLVGAATYVDAETPTGGTGTSFTLAHAPSPPLSLILVWDGLVRKQNASGDYTLSGTAITTAFSIDPAATNLLAWYRY